jgi:hypothetical protein
MKETAIRKETGRESKTHGERDRAREREIGPEEESPSKEASERAREREETTSKQKRREEAKERAAKDGDKGGTYKGGGSSRGASPGRLQLPGKVVKLAHLISPPPHITSCGPTYLPTYLHTYLPTYLPTYNNIKPMDLLINHQACVIYKGFNNTSGNQLYLHICCMYGRP